MVSFSVHREFAHGHAAGAGRGSHALETLVALRELVCANYLVKNAHVFQQNTKPAVDQLAVAMVAI